MVRVIVVTMLPNGGATTQALQQLGMRPYTLENIMSAGTATHLSRWAAWAAGAMKLDMRMFDRHDAVAGPPIAKGVLRELSRFPKFTKVILVEEADKERWQLEMGLRVLPAIDRLRAHERGRSVRALLSVLDASFVLPADRAELEAFRRRMEAARESFAAEEENEDAKQDNAPDATATAEGVAAPSATHSSGSNATAPPASEASIRAEEADSSMGTDGSNAVAPRLSGTVRSMRSGPPTTPEDAGGVASADAAAGATSSSSNAAVSATGASAAAAAAASDEMELVRALQAFEDQVKGTVPRDRLLVYREGDGWEPLLRFVGLDKIPPRDEEFPPFDSGVEHVENLVARAIASYHRQQRLARYLAVVCVLLLLSMLQFVPRYLTELWDDYSRTTVARMKSKCEELELEQQQVQRELEERIRALRAKPSSSPPSSAGAR